MTLHHPRLDASYRVVSVRHQLGGGTTHTTMYDAAIRIGTEIVWQEDRPQGSLCLTSGAATRRAKKQLALVQAWLAGPTPTVPLFAFGLNPVQLRAFDCGCIIDHRANGTIFYVALCANHATELGNPPALGDRREDT
jgi:hypothetical protein